MSIRSLTIALDYLNALFSRNPMAIRFQRNEIKVGRIFNGKIISDSDDNDNEQVNKKIRLFSKGWFGVKYYLGSTETYDDGNFTFECMKCIPGHKLNNIIIQCIEQNRPFEEKGLPGIYSDKVIQQWSVRTNKGHIVTLGNLYIGNDNNDQNNDNNNDDLTVIPKPPTNYQPDLNYLIRLGLALIPEKFKQLITDTFSGTAKDTQKVFDTLGIKYRKQNLNEDNLLRFLCNEVGSVNYTTKNNNNDLVIWKCEWPEEYIPDENNSLPNVIVVARKHEDWLKLEKISIRFQGSKVNQHYDFIPAGNNNNDNDNDDILSEADKKYAIYVAQSAFAILGEAVVHLTDGHLIPGIAQQAFITTIKTDNPLFSVVDPFLRDGAYINWAAQGTIFGQGSVLDASALKPEDVSNLIVDNIIKLSDWENNLPQEPCCEKHIRAEAYSFWVQHLKNFYRDYLIENKETILKNWDQIKDWSNTIRGRVSVWPKFDMNENEEPDLERLATFLSWLVGKTTFGHWAAHTRQETLTDLRESSFRMQNQGLNNDGNFDEYGNTVSKHGAAQLFFARFLMRFKADTIKANRKGLIPKSMHDHLCLGLTEIKKMGYVDADKMHLGTSI